MSTEISVVPAFTGSVWGTQRRVRANVRYVLCSKGSTFKRFAELISEMSEWPKWAGMRPDPIVRHVRRVLNGATVATLDHLEMFSEILGVPPAILAYGSAREVRQALGEWVL